jgi:hypothetical protein
MDKIPATIFAIPSLLYLAYDYKNRQKFNRLLENNNDNNYSLKSGIIISNEILQKHNELFSVEEAIIGKETTTKIRTYHTNLANISINITSPFSTLDWKTNSKHRKFVDGITLSNDPDLMLYINSDTKIMWNEPKNCVIKNDIKTTEKYLHNNIPCFIFGNIIDKNINVKYIGNKRYVTDKIRTEHYGINNWLTTLASVTLTLSASFILNQSKKSK